MQSTYVLFYMLSTKKLTMLNISRLVEKIKGYPLKAKSFPNTATYRKLEGGVPSTPLVSWWGYDFPCTSED